MPLAAYGVVVGAFDHFARDDPNNFGSWYHGKVYVNASAGVYEAAVDVSTPSGVRVQYRVAPIRAELFANVSALADGWHPLASTTTSGALDYVRSEALRLRLGCMFAPMAWLAKLLERILEGLLEARSWTLSNGDNALNELERNLQGASRLYVFGAPYTRGLGVHDVHMNQGDPPGQFQHLDAIWQDGTVVIERPDGLVGFLVKFETQTLRTGDDGLPLP
jgi:hypothetical protein